MLKQDENRASDRQENQMSYEFKFLTMIEVSNLLVFLMVGLSSVVLIVLRIVSYSLIEGVIVITIQAMLVINQLGLRALNGKFRLGTHVSDLVGSVRDLATINTKQSNIVDLKEKVMTEIKSDIKKMFFVLKTNLERDVKNDRSNE